MSDIQIPEDLAEVSIDDLQELQSRIQEAADALKDEPAANVEELEVLADSYERISEELAVREEISQQESERAESALNRITGGSSEAEVEEDAGEPVAEAATESTEELSEDAPSEAVEAPESEAPAAEETVDVVVEGAEEMAEEAADEAATEEVVEASAEEGQVQEAQTEEPEAMAESTPQNESLAGLRRARPAGASPEIEELSSRPVGTMVGATGLLGRKDQQINRHDLAEIIAHKSGQMAKFGTTPFDPVVLATHSVDFPEDRTLKSGERENYSVFSNAVAKAEALVASGGTCAPLAPSYDFFTLAESQSPVEDMLPTVGAQRGGIRYIQAAAYTEDVTDGVRFTTEAEDAAGYTNQTPAGTTAPKPCATVVCPPVAECQVDAISKCVTFGNLNYRVFPEQVEDFLNRLDTYFVEAKETFYIDKMVAGSTAVNVTPPYGAARGATYALGAAAWAYRKRHHMPIDAPLDALVPDTFIPFIKADMVNDASMGLGFIDADAETVAREIFTQFKVNVTWRYDNSTAEGPNPLMKQSQAAGPLNPYPTVYDILLFAPGTWVRLDLGVLDLGIVRDSSLNSTNDLQLFSEQWVQVCKVGIESLNLRITLCPDGSGPVGADLLACAS